ISEEVIQYYEKHPDELDLIINREHFNAAYLGFFFILGLLMTVLARVISYYYGDVLGEFGQSVVLDIISELGIAIFGGAVVAYFIENLNKKEYQKNVKFRAKIKAILDERKAKREANKGDTR
ncbi:MAG: hypothetical protein AAFU64_10500, partial [Bacteroidota bacterium]